MLILHCGFCAARLLRIKALATVLHLSVAIVYQNHEVIAMQCLITWSVVLSYLVT